MPIGDNSISVGARVQVQGRAWLCEAGGELESGRRRRASLRSFLPQPPHWAHARPQTEATAIIGRDSTAASSRDESRLLRVRTHGARVCALRR